MRQNKLAVTFIVLVMAVFLLTGCAKKQDDVIKIGAILPLSGDGASYGNSLKKGMEVGGDYYNSKNSKFKLEIIYEDGAGLPKETVSAFNKLVHIDKVSMIIGPMFSDPALAIAEKAQESRIVILAPTVSSTEFTKTGDFLFSIYPSESYDGKVMADFVLRNAPSSTVAIVSAQSEVMLNVSKAFKATYENAGGIITSFETYSVGMTDHRTTIEKTMKAEPSVIFIADFIEGLSTFLIQAKELGYSGQIVTISTAYDENLLKLAENSSNGLIFSAPFFDLQNPKISSFIAKYEESYKSKPDIWGAYGYDAINIALEAFLRSEKEDLPLNKALLETKNFPGITGTTSFNPDGSVQKELRIMKVENGSFVPFKQHDNS